MRARLMARRLCLPPLRDREIIKMLLDGGADVNYSDRSGRTPLHWAMEARDLALVDLLVSRGVTANASHKGRAVS